MVKARLPTPIVGGVPGYRLGYLWVPQEKTPWRPLQEECSNHEQHGWKNKGDSSDMMTVGCDVHWLNPDHKPCYYVKTRVEMHPTPWYRAWTWHWQPCSSAMGIVSSSIRPRAGSRDRWQSGGSLNGRSQLIRSSWRRSFPDVFVVPSLSAVLHCRGQLWCE